MIKPDNYALFHYWNQKNNKTPWYNCVELIDRESFLNGSTNLEKPMPNFNPQLKEIKSLSVIDKPTVFVVEPRAIDDKQRPYILN